MASSGASSGTSSSLAPEEKGAAEPSQSRSANAHSTASIIFSEPSHRRHGRLNFHWVLRLNQRAVPALRVLTNWKVETYIQERRAAGCVSSRDRLYRFLASPTSSGNALMFALLILAVSFASIITFGVESHQHSKQVSSALELYGENATAIEEHLGSLTPPYEEPLFAWNCVLAAMFTAELALRLATYPTPLRDSELWVDALALLPLILRIACASTPEGDLFYESALEMHMLGCRILGQTLTESFTALLIPTYFLFMLVTLFGDLCTHLPPPYPVTARCCSRSSTPRTHSAAGDQQRPMYDPYAERDGPRVLDIPTAWYLILVTMATVGYGDFSPQTAGGRILMGRARELALIAEEIKLRLLWRGRSLHDVLQAFEDFDSDRDGSRTCPEVWLAAAF
ncbi:hypothetical protein EMIHUDRAFT_117824 [Emiliania huxleyi CCMP1516]|uniref:Ion transport domain-containing protein n=2 Tax=Emiliania huxleyi TaxID=2903 RepID=A0A0D3J8F6_EMIH1|nr:hypothetical protein EMIHUDRAFT_117824 [Emiliania huxleyi CCMP1516]EOD19791.1 hypothetical protein EMIHUDRAFT_117824 [Emiliania huxleyi CCMP1516]|eukprot:XP_005772220.1 hypothetical protein EMIHUDRAFT_117824 [Emiliania huxleyi CCMP1516]